MTGRALILTLSMFLVASCGADGSAPPTDAPVETPSEPAVIDWTDPTQRVALPDGWSAGKCPGDAPMICVHRLNRQVGVVEATWYPTDSIDALDPTADDTANLEALALDFAEAIGSDRLIGCGADYGFDPFPPTPIHLGDTTGLSFGYTGTTPDGAPSELNLQYAAIQGDQVVLITAIAYDDGGCPGRDDLSSFTSAELAEFQPHLERVLADSPLPTGGR